MQDLPEHLAYLADAPRLAAYQAALRAVVKPGSTVVDLGCGTGVLGLLALRAGAAHVHAVDDGAMLEVARESFRRSGVLERISLIRARAQQANLATPADVAICDHLGWFGIDYGILGLLDDARARLLRLGGVVIPCALSLRVAAVETPRGREAPIAWERIPSDFRWLRDLWVDAKHSVRLEPADLLGEAVELGRVPLGERPREHLTWSARLRVERDGEVQGLAGWFEAELAPGVRMTNAPGAADRIDRAQAFLPIAIPARARAGDWIGATVTVRPEDELIAWDVEVPEGGARFRHSTFHGMAFSAEALARAKPERVPRATAAARARMLVLGYCDGRRSAAEVRDAVLREHAGLLPSPDEIRRFVVEVLRTDTAS